MLIGGFMLYDKDIRGPLFEFLDVTFGKNRIIEEKQIGKARADIMMVLEDALVGIEIKSDADSYVRLPKQIRFYNLFFDYNIIVVGTKHAHSVTEHVPEWWGIITVEEVDGRVDFLYYRSIGENNKSRYRIERQTNILWRIEIQNILARRNFHAYAQKSKKFVVEKLVSELSKEELKHEICYELFERDYTTIADEIAEFKESRVSRKNSNDKSKEKSKDKNKSKKADKGKNNKAVDNNADYNAAKNAANNATNSNSNNKVKQRTLKSSLEVNTEVTIFDFAIPDFEDK